MTGRLLTAHVVADTLGVHPETVLRWNRQGNFAGVSLQLPGGAIRFRADALEGWLAEQATPTRSLPTTTPSAALRGTVQSITPTTTDDEED